MTRFVGIPSVPLDLDNNLVRVLMSIKENVELLTGQRGESDEASKALTLGSISTNTVSGNFQALSAKGQGVKINNVAVPYLDDYVKALRDIQQLAVDVAALRTVVNQLITELRN